MLTFFSILLSSVAISSSTRQFSSCLFLLFIVCLVSFSSLPAVFLSFKSIMLLKKHLLCAFF